MQLNLRPSIAAPTDALRADSAALYAALTDLVRAYQFRDRDRICCHDISVTQCNALEVMVEAGPMRLNALAERLFLDKSTSSRVIGALLRKGYVERLADLKDARAISLRVTPRGRALYERIREDLIQQQQQMIADVAPATRRAAIQVITRLARTAEQKFGLGKDVSCPPGCCGNRT